MNGWLPEPPELDPRSLRQPLEVEAVSGLDDLEDRDTDLLSEFSGLIDPFGCLWMVFTGVASSFSNIRLSMETLALISMSEENSEYSEEAEGLGVEDMSETIPLDKAESKLLFSDDGVLAGLERLLLYIPIK